ncbi:MIT domain-containing protein 1-like [Daphnia pulicaria]|uniref:MIT domain-containing protein 1-like n=1 Tax=Daphnia pulicaria TaxID=35523 RepID=UPI001EEA1662|nr:MIT domain-containing protein 1-like [Daphnia pulicaria]XP_046641302.1 MIT domain-containing protein 1-like [Daphnia pulicaria]XP_046641304.1 MIT domain-containing protein 1-like [Daphnia pulicaria]XP_046641305.1 MIT domain-containing protein 1-like [Daphnia pulicaria]
MMAGDPVAEKAAASVLKRAVELDTAKRFTESLVCYQEGLQLLMEALKAKGQEDGRRAELRKRVVDYMDRAEFLKKHVENEKEAGKYHEKIEITANSVGYSYQKVLGRFLDEHVTRVEIEDPYIRSIHQVYNLLRLSELLVSNCRNLKSIFLLTGREPGNQQEMLDELKQSLAKHKVVLTVEYSTTLHDREIRLDNGWVIKIGRGLDYFRPPEGKFSLGYCDFDLRQCHATTIDIFHSSTVRSIPK